MNTCGSTSKTEIISLLSDVNRDGIGNVIAYLNQSDYFTAHCHHHHRYEKHFEVWNIMHYRNRHMRMYLLILHLRLLVDIVLHQ